MIGSRYISLLTLFWLMTSSVLAPIKAAPLCELPVSVLKIAAGFSAASLPGFDAVSIKPGLDGEVIVIAAQPIRVVELRCTGSCQRPLALPIRALRVALSRDKDAEHCVIAEADGLLSLRTFSSSCTVAVSVPEAPAVGLALPPVTPGPCEVGFGRDVLFAMLRDLGPLQKVMIALFSNGLQLTGSGEGFSVVALVAGVEH